jgi:hypothetical protein
MIHPIGNRVQEQKSTLEKSFKSTKFLQERIQMILCGKKNIESSRIKNETYCPTFFLLLLLLFLLLLYSFFSYFPLSIVYNAFETFPYRVDQRPDSTDQIERTQESSVCYTIIHLSSPIFYLVSSIFYLDNPYFILVVLYFTRVNHVLLG